MLYSGMHEHAACNPPFHNGISSPTHMSTSAHFHCSFHRSDNAGDGVVGAGHSKTYFQDQYIICISCAFSSSSQIITLPGPAISLPALPHRAGSPSLAHKQSKNQNSPTIPTACNNPPLVFLLTGSPVLYPKVYRMRPSSQVAPKEAVRRGEFIPVERGIRVNYGMRERQSCEGRAETYRTRRGGRGKWGRLRGCWRELSDVE